MTTAEWAQLDPGPDPIIERYKADVDRTLIRENLRKSHEERLLDPPADASVRRRASCRRQDDPVRRMIEFRRLLESLERTFLNLDALIISKKAAGRPTSR